METPCQPVSSFDHFVTQWMSAVTCSLGSAWSSSQVQRTGSTPEPSIVNVHSSSGVWGVGPAERTGKSSVRYCPGGIRSEGPSRRRPLNPLETIPTRASARCDPGDRLRYALELAHRCQPAVLLHRPAVDLLRVGVD